MILLIALFIVWLIFLTANVATLRGGWRNLW